MIFFTLRDLGGTTVHGIEPLDLSHGGRGLYEVS